VGFWPPRASRSVPPGPSNQRLFGLHFGVFSSLLVSFDGLGGADTGPVNLLKRVNFWTPLKRAEREQ